MPAKAVFLTDGRTRQVKVGNRSLMFRHAPPKELPLGKPMSAMVFQALRHLGPAAIDEQVVGRLRTALSPLQRKQIMRDARYTTDWIRDAIARTLEAEPVHG